jgi:hypothetical protein
MAFFSIGSAGNNVDFMTAVNANRNRNGKATNVSAAGVLPATLGALGSLNGRSAMMCWFEN